MRGTGVMGRSVFVTPLYKPGGREVLSYLLELEDLTILLDCGWNDAFDVEDIQPLIDVVPKVDVVLLSHPDLEHLGALSYLVGKCGLEAPIYATLPVFKMGQMFMYDHWLSLRAVSDFDVFDLDDVDKAFNSITPLKYQQELALEGESGRGADAGAGAGAGTGAGAGAGAAVTCLPAATSPKCWRQTCCRCGSPLAS